MAAPFARRYFASEQLILKVHRLPSSGDEPTVGYLIGQEKQNNVHLSGLALCHDSKAVMKTLPSLEKHLPGGLWVFGLFIRAKKGDFPEICEQVIPKELMNTDYFYDGNMIVLVAGVDQDIENAAFYHYDLSGGKVVKEIKPELLNTSIMDTSVLFRVRAQIPIQFEYNSSNEILEDHVAVEFEKILEKLKSDLTLFHIANSNILLHLIEPIEARVIPINHNAPCVELIEQTKSMVDKKRKVKNITKEVVHVNLVFQTTGERAAKKDLDYAPVIHHEHKNFRMVTIHLPLDAVVLLDPQTPVKNLAKWFSEGLQTQLIYMQQCILQNRNSEKFCTPIPHHIKPQGMDFLLTVVYPDGIGEIDLEKQRTNLHKLFLLPQDRPCFRRGNAFKFPDENYNDGYLRNTHIGLPHSGVDGGKVYTVQGIYSYHHYLQDKMDDTGWGCAYRSLQTLVSWFRQQGYTEKPIPTHADIQKALVSYGDKQASFVGSKKWIGSIEVCFALEYLCEVSCKICEVSSGQEMVTKGRELAMHFEEQGTPVMIGGGVLAHTIVGVDFNEVSGQVKFLILDPHYTGAEDLKTIQDKGWCGWKGPDFWDKNAFYNMCMPQRPVVI